MKRLFTALLLSTSLLASAAGVDLKNSMFKWRGEKLVGSYHHGSIDLKSADLQMDGNKIASGEFVIDMKTIKVLDEGMGDQGKKGLIGHLSNDDFFNVGEFPTAKLVVVSDNGKEIVANVTIRDKTNKETIKYTRSGNQLKGSFVFDRTKYGVNFHSENKDVGWFGKAKEEFRKLKDKVIKNDIKIDFTVSLQNPA